MMKSVLILDFNDSFTHNLESLFYDLKYEVSCLHWSKAEATVLADADLIVLGPGPGHPHEYKKIWELLPELKEKPIFGVCLGFQILLNFLGGELIQLKMPLHGQSIGLPKLGQAFGFSDFKAQFYNSWSVCSKNLPKDCQVISEHDMTVYFCWENWLGVQFHPESVGTTCPSSIVEGVLKRLGV